ncbi:hypothetical protein KQX54_000256, partial [Cotesia glomerata]
DHSAKTSLSTVGEVPNHDEFRKPHGNPPTTADGSLDYDADLMEKSWISRISSLYRKVKNWDGFNKKLLYPHCLLKRRSLLEMYADYFAHPEHFYALPIYQLQKKEWFKWHDGTYAVFMLVVNLVLQKPYNPILGEIFRCYWDAGKSNNSHRNETTRTRG